MTSRAGISLLEVLIAMFVMLFGLMGVAAIFPVGNHYAGKGDEFDRGASLAGSAFAELRSRGIMRPQSWYYANQDPQNNVFIGTPLINGTTNQFSQATNAGHAFVIDPIGGSDETSLPGGRQFFPYGVTANPWTSTTPALLGAGWPIRRVTLPTPIPGTNPVQFNAMGPRVAEAIFRLRDDVTVAMPEENDRPGILRWSVTDNNTPATPKREFDDTRLARSYTGSYSWLATVVPANIEALSGLQPADPRHSSFLYEVSVAVFHRREEVPSADSERLLEAELRLGGELVLFARNNDVEAVDTALQDIGNSQWIALAGVNPNSGVFVLRWCQCQFVGDNEETVEDASVQVASNVAARHLTVLAPEWPQTKIDKDAGAPIENLRAILLPNVISVATQTVKLETD